MRIVHENKFTQVLTQYIDRTNEIRITADQHKRSRDTCPADQPTHGHTDTAETEL